MRMSLVAYCRQACPLGVKLSVERAGRFGRALRVYGSSDGPRPRRPSSPAVGVIACYATGTSPAHQEPAVAASPEQPSAKNVVLMDASCFCYRYYHAASHAMSSRGSSTAIEHLFLAQVLAIVSGQHSLGFGPASQLVVVFDSPPSSTGGVPLRRSMYPAYKGNRSTPPDAVIAALDTLPTVLQAMGINTLMLPGVEADDVIATLAKAFNQSQLKVTIYSSDKDFRQLLSQQACLARLNALETEDSFVAEHHFRPEFFSDYQALTGDAADNVAGVKGIGPKRAKNLISKYLTIENVYTALPEMASNAVSKSLADADVAQVLQMRTLFQLQRHVRSKDGEDLLDMLPFGHVNLLSFDQADVDWVVNYMDRLELSQDKAAFLAILEGRSQRTPALK
eukprot:jgi/Ulvmu1/5316/UM022_0110.1